MTKTAFLFAGQGAQYVGMGRDFYEKYSRVREIFGQASEVLGFDLARLCFEGPEEALTETANAQPAILTVSYAIFEMVREAGLAPDVAAGLSLGEYTALVAAGSIDFPSAVALVRQRGKFMQEAVPLGEGTMAAILGLEREKVEEACRLASDAGVVEPANYNCPGQLVIAGQVGAVQKAVNLAKEAGAKRAMMLAVSAPFHCSMMKPAGDRLAEVLDQTPVGDARISVVANAAADYVGRADQIRKSLVRQVSAPVRFEDSVRRMIDDGVGRFLEIGPGKTLSGFVKKVSREVETSSVDSPENMFAVLDAWKLDSWKGVG